jgi:hypothetical protein
MIHLPLANSMYCPYLWGKYGGWGGQQEVLLMNKNFVSCTVWYKNYATIPVGQHKMNELIQKARR